MNYGDDYDPQGERDTRDSDLSGAPTFFVFAGYNYYPAGGMNDFHSSHHTIEDARTAEQEATSTKHGHDWAHIAQFTAEGLIEVR